MIKLISKIAKLFLVLIFASIIISSTTVIAHSGRTDSSGGHKDNKNASGLGSYHFHHGYDPHLHPNGICPYANTNKSIYNPSTDTITTPKPTNKPNQVATITTTPQITPIPTMNTVTLEPTKNIITPDPAKILSDIPSTNRGSTDLQKKQLSPSQSLISALGVLILLGSIGLLITGIIHAILKKPAKKFLIISGISFVASIIIIACSN